MSKLRLYHYWRSSSSWRVRWGLAIKGIEYEAVAVNLLSGESESPEHLERNPLGQVPVLEIEPGAKSGAPLRLFESIAILEWLEESYPERPLLPRDPWLRARTRQLAEIINSETQPLQNLTPQELHSDDPAKRKAWAQYWIRNGLKAYETVVKETAGRFSVGDHLTIADLCLVPQCYNATRYEIPLANYPIIARIHEAAKLTESYRLSAPEAFQPPAAQPTSV